MFNVLKKYILIISIIFVGIASISLVTLHSNKVVPTVSTQELPTQKAPTLHVTIFIHGTVGSTLNIFNPWSLATEEYDPKSFSVRTIKNYRNQPIMQYDQILGKEGFYEFSTHHYNLPNAAMAIEYSQHMEPWHASTLLIPAYHALDKYSRTIQSDIHKTVIFGWSGLLHASARKGAGYMLYQELCDYIEKLKQQYGVMPKVTIVTHSHGGNVSLWLDAAEKEFKRGLVIDCLCMYGTPMHQEMKDAIESSLFKTMILFHSHGDSIQLRDYFSTKTRKSYQKMSDIADCKKTMEQFPGCKRYDVCCAINGNYKHITHMNMWFVGRSTAVLDCMDPMPLVVLTPLFLPLFEDQEIPLLSEIHVVCNHRNGFSFQIYDVKKKEIVVEPYKNDRNILATLSEWSNKMKQEWQLPDDTWRHPIFNKKNYKALKNMFWGQ